MRRLLLAMLSVVMVGACTTPDAPTANRTTAAVSGATIRYLARGIYESLAARSCAEPSSEQLRAVEREEAAFAAALESTLVGPVTEHVALAKEDVAFLSKSNALSCWGKSERDFADLHREMFFDSVETLRDELRHPNFRPQSIRGLDRYSMPRGAEFRRLVRSVLDSIRWKCTATDQRPFLVAAKPEVAQFAQRIERTQFAGQFAIAKADLAFLDQYIASNCALTPVEVMPVAERNARLSTLSRRIAAAERIAGI